MRCRGCSIEKLSHEFPRPESLSHLQLFKGRANSLCLRVRNHCGLNVRLTASYAAVRAQCIQDEEDLTDTERVDVEKQLGDLVGVDRFVRNAQATGDASSVLVRSSDPRLRYDLTRTVAQISQRKPRDPVQRDNDGERIKDTTE